MIRRRPVSFGNPALGTYHGFVYTLEGEAAPTVDDVDNVDSTTISSHCDDPRHHRWQRQLPVVEDATQAHCLVAVVNVPPEQIPEGILNLSRPHRSFLQHVRIVIAEPDEPPLPELPSALSTTRPPPGDEPMSLVTSNIAQTVPPSLNASAMESAASILAQEQEQQITNRCKEGAMRNGLPTNEPLRAPERTYLVLMELCSEEAARELVLDLHGQPYTSLDETVTCSVHVVVALQGVAGVSLMSPFFAPSTAAARLQLVPQQALSSSSSSSSSPTSTQPVPATSNDDGSLAPNFDSARSTGGGPNNTKTATEDYNCAVCLEHMDLGGASSSSTSHNAVSNENPVAILTTVCNHSFHLDCLVQWQDSPCPVCRYDHSGLNEALSQCHVCGTTEHNYVCLICGVVSCGGGDGAGRPVATAAAGSGLSATVGQRPVPSQCTVAASTASATTTDTIPQCRSEEPLEATVSQHYNRIQSSSHARRHYNETLHAYALNTETQHVWDFAGQGYVHRLLQNKEDGKLVEVNDPSNTTSHERSLSPGLTEAQEGEVVHRKLEGFASQYYTLLKSQLEQQRIYYEGRLEEIRHEYSASRRQVVVDTTDLVTALKQERHQLSQRLQSLHSKCRKVQGNVGFIKSLNESLEANRLPLRRQLEQAQRDRAEARQMFDECLPPLQEKVTRLMLQLETTSAAAAASTPYSNSDSDHGANQSDREGDAKLPARV
jgi:RING-H2 zinc finger domain/Zn-finger in ubiquitin-hydrolases and other protein